MDLVQSLQKKGIRIVAVTKNRSPDEIRRVLAQGINDIGENRLQEVKQKLPELPAGLTKHFIGRLQTNKVHDVVELFDMIQSVDRLELAQKIDQAAKALGKIMPVLIQVNTSGEPQKGGVKPEEMFALIQKMAAMPHLQVQGLMTVALESEHLEKVRECFKILKSLSEQIAQVKIPGVQMQWLSMGMSQDFLLALEEGANMVRLGRILFDGLSD